MFEYKKILLSLCVMDSICFEIHVHRLKNHNHNNLVRANRAHACDRKKEVGEGEECEVKEGEGGKL